jgi:DNA-binding Lrp family transcriptional regulator
MEESMEVLQQKRKSLYKKLEKIGVLRRGVVSVNYRKCGKKNCICAKEGHPGHGPRYLWNATIKGKSYAKDIKLGPEVKKYIEETKNYRTFVKLCDEIIQVNERIADLRPATEVKDASELDRLKKNLQRYFMKKYKKKLTG